MGARKVGPGDYPSWAALVLDNKIKEMTYHVTAQPENILHPSGDALVRVAHVIADSLKCETEPQSSRHAGHQFERIPMSATIQALRQYRARATGALPTSKSGHGGGCKGRSDVNEVCTKIQSADDEAEIGRFPKVCA